MVLHLLGLDSGSAGTEVKVPWMAVMGGEVEKGIVSVLEIFSESLSVRFQTNSVSVGSRSASCLSMRVMRCRPAVEWDCPSALSVVTVMPQLHQSVLLVLSRSPFARRWIRSVVVWLVRGWVLCRTCASIGLHSNIDLMVWIVVVCLYSLSEQPVLPELLSDSEE